MIGIKRNRSVGELLKESRLRAGKTQEEVARHLHVNRSMISRWENDEIPAPYEVVRQFCAYTNGTDLLTIDLTDGGVDGWKKLRKLETFVANIKAGMETVNFLRRRDRNAGTELGRVRRRI
ncbi:helix-turn-helix domain-containing protein [Cohnella xylanilytica]|uniref:helix-turn-helix domain-containing protein n=1 Tax=Cohnella xylanilytica TaxID=557555 RepID=UPI001BB3F333|nr:helix-turn-helix transcriptional regulator [Cohnella xylanilytica]